jgi:endonuclease/exonuclease/phosphatase family metal-dependent hydrolase
MRVATWNMNYWRRTPEDRAAAWSFLTDLGLDVALVQEANPPDGLAAIHRPGGIDQHRRWGSAIVSFAGGLRALDQIDSPEANKKLDLLRTFPGSVAIAEHVDAGEPVVFVGAYGVLDGGYAITTMHRVLFDLTPLLDSRIGKRLVLGGDLNCSTQLEGRDRERHRNLFDRFASLGLVDLLGATAGSRPTLEDCPCSDDPCLHVRTVRHARSVKPWHDDYLFATRALAKHLRDCQPVSEAHAWELSDHCPVLAEFQ